MTGRRPQRRYLDLKDRPRRRRAFAASLLTLTVGSVYLFWLSRLVLLRLGIPDLLFLMAEGLSFLLLCLLACDVWHLRGHRPEGLHPSRPWSVDVLVPCCQEPLEVIKTTLHAVKRIAYEPLEVYILDDGASPQVARLAERLGFHYLSRPESGLTLQDSKSGNLNFGLQHGRGELILVLDADQVPAPEILSRLVGFFDLDRVAYVQSQQTFFLPDGDPFYNADRVFYETIQLSNDHANAVTSCGSGVVYRRQPLEEMGGFATWNLVEDFTTSYELLSRGWRGLYFPYALVPGTGPGHPGRGLPPTLPMVPGHPAPLLLGQPPVEERVSLAPKASFPHRHAQLSGQRPGLSHFLCHPPARLSPRRFLPARLRIALWASPPRLFIGYGADVPLSVLPKRVSEAI